MDDHFIASAYNWDKIADSFDHTRQQPWKIVIDFISQLSESDVIAEKNLFYPFIVIIYQDLSLI